MIKLEGKIYDFGDASVAKHLHSLAEEIAERAEINDDANLKECAQHLKTLADASVESAHDIQFIANEVEEEEFENAQSPNPEPSSRAETLREIGNALNDDVALYDALQDSRKVTPAK